MMISLIMLTYNRENMVSRAIESILVQTMRDFEFIIVDNGSTDNSGKIAEEYAARDSRIQVIHRPRGNIGSGRNTGLDIARGDYVAFIDDDDWAEPDYLEFLYQLAVKNLADVSICGTSSAFSDTKLIMSAEEAVIQTMWRKLFKVGFPGKLFRKELIKDLRFPEDTIHDDNFLMHKVLGGAERVAYHGLLKYHIFHGPTSTTSWKDDFHLMTPELLEDLLASRKLRTQWCSENFPNNSLLFHYFEWSFMLSMLEKVKRLKLETCSQKAEEILLELRLHKDEFLNCKYCQEFERQWITQYIE